MLKAYIGFFLCVDKFLKIKMAAKAIFTEMPGGGQRIITHGQWGGESQKFFIAYSGSGTPKTPFKINLFLVLPPPPPPGGGKPRAGAPNFPF